MCLSCGCNKPNERHGDDRHIVMQDLQDAATASEISTQEVVKNIQEGFEAGRATDDDRQPAGSATGGAPQPQKAPPGASPTGAPD